MVRHHGCWFSYYGGMLARDRRAIDLCVRVVRQCVRDVPHHRRLGNGHRLRVQMRNWMHSDVSDWLAAVRGRYVCQVLWSSVDDRGVGH